MNKLTEQTLNSLRWSSSWTVGWRPKVNCQFFELCFHFYISGAVTWCHMLKHTVTSWTILSLAPPCYLVLLLLSYVVACCHTKPYSVSWCDIMSYSVTCCTSICCLILFYHNMLLLATTQSYILPHDITLCHMLFHSITCRHKLPLL